MLLNLVVAYQITGHVRGEQEMRVISACIGAVDVLPQLSEDHRLRLEEQCWDDALVLKELEEM